MQTLEQLVNSNSVASSIKQPFILRRFNWVTVALLVLWGLSPLASQAMQRISYTVEAQSFTDKTVGYLGTTEANLLGYTSHSEQFTEYQPDFNRLFSAAFLPTDSSSQNDIFGNPLIPVLRPAP